KEKVVALLKTLPQKYRQRLQPLEAFAAGFCSATQDGERPLLGELTSAIEERLAMKLPLDAFRPAELRPHLLMNFRLLDEHGATLAMSRSLAELRALHGARVEQSFAAALPHSDAADTDTALSGLTTWSFGELPELQEIVVAGRRVIGFPALVDQGESVALQVFDTPEKAQLKHRAGLRRLFALGLREQVKYLDKTLLASRELRDMALQFIHLGGEQELREQLIAATLERSCLMPPLPSTATEFEARLLAARPRINLVAQEYARLLGSIVSEHAQVLKKITTVAKAFPAVATDVKGQCAGLLAKGFLLVTPFERLQHLPRYLKAASLRLDKLRSDPARDARLLAEWQQLATPWERERLARQKAGISDVFLEEFRWLLEELRVALFAQELRTPTPVSVKRLQKAWQR
ncbi:MAG: DUF3418 domain-containing protein, partial [Proteobacteria bacterium]|nr:DUF3418 domain-containing protein [Pseudomonadota bacterium]